MSTSPTAVSLADTPVGKVMTMVQGWGSANIVAQVPVPGLSVQLFEYDPDYLPTEGTWGGTPVTVYTDSTLTTELSQPLTTAADGSIAGWVDSGQQFYVVCTYPDGRIVALLSGS